MTYAGGIRNRRKLDKKGGFDKRTADAKAYSVGDLCLGVPGSGFHQKEPRNY